jgi:hypothetical protein
MEIATFLPKATGHFSFLSYWLMACIWAFHSSFPIPLRIAQGLSNAFKHFQRLSNTLSAVPNGCLTSF